MDRVDQLHSEELHSAPGMVIAGRFRLDAEIGRGGYGQVWRARQLSVDRDVALKLLRADLKHREDAARRFAREARLASRMRHPNAVGVIDFGDDGGTLFLAMELIEGPTLKEYLRARGRLGWSEACALVERIAAALAEAHALGLVHRDLKPGNVLLRTVEGRLEPVVIDFGLAKVFDADEVDDAITRAHAMVGTPAYMSPEAVRGGPLEPRSDLYSLGVILFELIAGRAPFKGSSPMETASRHLHAAPPSLADAVADVPSGVAGLVDALLAKDPAARPADAARLRALLREQGQAPPASAAETPDMTQQPMLRPAAGPRDAQGAYQTAVLGAAALGRARALAAAPTSTAPTAPAVPAAPTAEAAPVAPRREAASSARAATPRRWLNGRSVWTGAGVAIAGLIAVVLGRTEVHPQPATNADPAAAQGSTVVPLSTATGPEAQGTPMVAPASPSGSAAAGLATPEAVPRAPVGAAAPTAGDARTAVAPSGEPMAPAVASTAVASTTVTSTAPPASTASGVVDAPRAQAGPSSPPTRGADETPITSGGDRRDRRDGQRPTPAQTGRLLVMVDGASTFRLDGSAELASDEPHAVTVGPHRVSCPSSDVARTVSVSIEDVAQARLDCRSSAAPDGGSGAR